MLVDMSVERLSREVCPSAASAIPKKAVKQEHKSIVS
jgi:hypothetical protein